MMPCCGALLSSQVTLHTLTGRCVVVVVVVGGKMRCVQRARQAVLFKKEMEGVNYSYKCHKFYKYVGY